LLIAQAEQIAAMGGLSLPERDDPLALRAFIDPQFKASHAPAGPAPDVTYKAYETTTADGATIDMRWYTKAGSEPGSAVVYIHGGGLVCGSIELYDILLRAYVQWTGVPFLAVDNRLAPEVTGTTITDDSFEGLQWLLSHASEE